MTVAGPLLQLLPFTASEKFEVFATVQKLDRSVMQHS
jgi:hypothetical protein